MNLLSSFILQAVTPVSQQVSSDNPNRRGLIVQVKSGGIVSIKFGGSVAVDNNGFTDGIDISGTLILDRNCPTGSINVIGSVNSIVLIHEIIESY